LLPTTSSLETEWDYSGRKGKDGQKKKKIQRIRKDKREKEKKSNKGVRKRGCTSPMWGIRWLKCVNVNGKWCIMKLSSTTVSYESQLTKCTWPHYSIDNNLTQA